MPLNQISNQHRLSYRPDIDGLRALAVLSVVFGHAGLGFPGGYTGVDIFFVISGYLITSLIIKDLEDGCFSLKEFWKRRIRRILPALLSISVFVLAAGWFILLPEAYRSTAKSIMAVTSLISNFYFWSTTGYFAEASSSKPMLHTWSLAVEEQFYLLIPILCIFIYRTEKKYILYLLASVFFLSFGLSVYAVNFCQSVGFYFLPTRAWELMAGGILGWLTVSNQIKAPRFPNLVATIGMGMIFYAIATYNDQTKFPGFNALLPVVGSAILIWTGQDYKKASIVNRILSLPPLVGIGLISYSLYLWHWPLLVLTKKGAVLPLTAGVRFFIVVLSLLISFLSWKFIERPFRKSEFLIANRTPEIAILLGLFSIFSLGFTVSQFDGFKGRLTGKAEIFAAAEKIDWDFVRDLTLKDIPDKITCYGDRKHAEELIVWGDSHAMSLLPALKHFSEESGRPICSITRSDNPPVITSELGMQLLGTRPDAFEFSEGAFKYIQSSKSQFVLLVAFWSKYFKDPKFVDCLNLTMKKLISMGKTVYFMEDVPIYDFEVPDALARYSLMKRDLKGLAITPEDYWRINSFSSAFIPEARKMGVKILSPLDLFQKRTSFNAVLPLDVGGVFYRDREHLTTYGSKVLTPLLDGIFKSG